MCIYHQLISEVELGAGHKPICLSSESQTQNGVAEVSDHNSRISAITQNADYTRQDEFIAIQSRIGSPTSKLRLGLLNPRVFSYQLACIRLSPLPAGGLFPLASASGLSRSRSSHLRKRPLPLSIVKVFLPMTHFGCSHQHLLFQFKS
jgi:hypothetical protein